MRKWEVCFLIGAELSKCIVEAESFKVGISDTMIYAEFVNHEPQFEHIAFYSNVVYVHQLVEQGEQ